MVAEIHCKVVLGARDPAWRWTGVLYAYLDARCEEMLYMGKAYGKRVRERWSRQEGLLG